jgi:hypothetical protein
MDQDKSIGKWSEPKLVVCSSKYNDSNESRENFKYPGEIVLGVNPGPNQDKKINGQPGYFHILFY